MATCSTVLQIDVKCLKDVSCFLVLITVSCQYNEYTCSRGSLPPSILGLQRSAVTLDYYLEVLFLTTYNVQKGQYKMIQP